MRISDILRTKGGAVVTAAPSDTVRDLVARLAEHNIGAVVVSTDGVAVEGIVSERDVTRGLTSGAAVLDAQVSTIMTTDVQTCAEDEPIEHLMRLMTERRIRHVPVLAEDGTLAGLVSIGDVVKNRIGQLEFEKEQLEGYIAR